MSVHRLVILVFMLDFSQQARLLLLKDSRSLEVVGLVDVCGTQSSSILGLTFHTLEDITKSPEKRVVFRLTNEFVLKPC